jgi:hypothetical protein
MEGQSASNPKFKCRICIHEVQTDHYVGFVFSIVESGLASPRLPLVGKTKEEALNKCLAWAKQLIPDCVFSAQPN